MAKICKHMVSANHKESCTTKNAQQSVHLTLGILRTSQAVLHALAFFWLDGFAVPAPAQVTQSVGTTPPKLSLENSIAS